MRFLVLLFLAGCATHTTVQWHPEPEDRDLTDCYWQSDSPDEAPSTHHWVGLVYEDVNEDFIAYYVCRGSI